MFILSQSIFVLSIKCPFKGFAILHEEKKKPKVSWKVMVVASCIVLYVSLSFMLTVPFNFFPFRCNLSLFIIHTFLGKVEFHSYLTSKSPICNHAMWFVF